jgi:CheY-like chemotaxis protein
MSTLPRVLIVEDNPGDIFLFQECLRERRMDIDLLVASEVEEGIRLLDGSGTPPCLTLIDLHLPKRDGKHLLAYLREQPRFNDMPAVVLSSSQRPSDHAACFGLGAREVRVKPSDWNGYCQLVGELSHYWSASGPSAQDG